MAHWKKETRIFQAAHKTESFTISDEIKNENSSTQARTQRRDREKKNRSIFTLKCISISMRLKSSCRK